MFKVTFTFENGSKVEAFANARRKSSGGCT